MANKYDKLIFEVSKEGSKGYSLPQLDVAEVELSDIIPSKYLNEGKIDLPEVGEFEVVRHFTNLSNKNHGLDAGFYPLGSCTMKYNPKINEDMAGLSGFTNIHPYQSEDTVQGALEVMYNLDEKLSEIAGFARTTLQPAAGSHGEYTGLLVIKAYHEKNGDTQRTKIIVPDSAHGTNPSSAQVAGFDIIEIKSNKDGSVNVESLKAALENKEEIAGLMLTNPSTLGLFERNIKEITSLVHEAGGLNYYDGANMNAIMGKVRPGDMGFDVMHYNLHKTMSTPHGCGGPGAGPIGVREDLVEFLPTPVIEKKDDKFVLDYDRPNSIGSIKGYYGNFSVLVRAYTYILTMGAEGLREASESAVLNANYMMNKLKEDYYLPIDQVCKHEFVLGGLQDKSTGVTTMDVAKRLLDFGYHPPTVYFPLIINEAMMIEPTETESKATMDGFIETLITIAKEAKEDPDKLHNAPFTTQVRRVDEAKAAKDLILKYTK
ncbi:glycine dehydrogenase [decarboxylating] subunit 2 [Gottschalkia acidurici 9a]|uniref:Probable glycine dehydrogenase (decarboxylating) subunit 2 n=1 Tax=Gottschalkia acidurici (strain ATCC 7906 / DSM 604 / BCRC 14475 / CIP 104303 / KCTC 5404 / NCIMB 10678 / 9a) TaxID=1128398 RepID=K0ATH3_GOTA9|nr:aminomethyl-transferring glycine dehydrogenase subunit GcvPB [Gottschalkia acidurici]AFS77158.1 glycine dehydrogenase [decarboxylating] subunit 2 [Gottschalkia acidurici 9a]